jgi:hypothetical protein
MTTRRTAAVALVLLLALPWTATAAGPGPRAQSQAGGEAAILETLWQWLSAALPWLQGGSNPAPAPVLKEGVVPPPRPPIMPLGGVCIDPDGGRVPCNPNS